MKLGTSRIKTLPNNQAFVWSVLPVPQIFREPNMNAVLTEPVWVGLPVWGLICFSCGFLGWPVDLWCCFLVIHSAFYCKFRFSDPIDRGILMVFSEIPLVKGHRHPITLFGSCF